MLRHLRANPSHADLHVLQVDPGALKTAKDLSRGYNTKLFPALSISAESVPVTVSNDTAC